MVEIQTRSAKLSDVSRMLEVYTPYVLETAYSYYLEVPDRSVFENIIDSDNPVIVAEIDGKVMGYAYVVQFKERYVTRFNCEISLYVDSTLRRGGVGNQLLAHLEKALAHTHYKQIYAVIMEDNRASINFHKKNGFIKVGHFPNMAYKFGKWHGDVILCKQIKAIEKPTN